MRLKNEKKVFEVPVLYPMGAFTFAIACSHCKNLSSDKCEDCIREIKSGFEPKAEEPVKHGMNLKDRETVQRALGIIEGVTCGVSKEAAERLYTAAEMIDVALFKGDNNEPQLIR